jgi:hypothetical protein
MEEQGREEYKNKERRDTANHPLSNPILFTTEMRLQITGYVPNRLVSNCISETGDTGHESGKCLGIR